MIVPIVFEIQVSFCLQEKVSWEWYQEECKTLRDSPFKRFPVIEVLEIPPLEIPRFRDSPS